MASTPVMAISSRPTSLSFRKERGGALSKARLMPFDSAEKMPSPLHSRNAKPMMVMLPRESMAESITPVIVSASSGVPARTCSITKFARLPLAEEERSDHDAQDQELEDREHAEIGHAARVLQRLVGQEAADRAPRDARQRVTHAPAVQVRDLPLRSLHHRFHLTSQGSCPLGRAGYPVAMARTESETLTLDGHEVTISNPGKIFFADAGITKIDLVQYYLAVADGALLGVRDRPMALKRFVDGAAGQAFFQKRAPKSVPEFVRTVELSFPSGRTADEVVVDNAAALAWVVNLGCIDLNPHPVRSGDLDHPDELRVDLDPGPGVAWADVRSRGAGGTRGARGARLHRLAEDVRLSRHPRLRPHQARLGVRRRASRGPGAGARGRAPGSVAGDVEVVEGGAPRRLPRLQPERQGPHGGIGLLGAASPRRHRQRAAALGRGGGRGARGLHAEDRAGDDTRSWETSAPASTSRRSRSSRCWSW